MQRRNNSPGSADRTGKYDEDVTDALAIRYCDLLTAVYRQAWLDLDHEDEYTRKTARILLGKERRF